MSAELKIKIKSLAEVCGDTWEGTFSSDYPQAQP